MNPTALVFFLVNAVLLFALPRKWAPIPLIVGTAYMTVGSGIQLGGVNLPIYRMLLLVGLARAVVKNEFSAIALNKIDKLLLAWAVWHIFASFFHVHAEGSGPVYATGGVFNLLGAYFLIRVWTLDPESVLAIIRFTAIALAPLAFEMVLEHVTGKNMFSVFGRVTENAVIRNGKLRAQGPFPSPILAGTVGAACVPLMFAIWRENRNRALIGLASCVVIVFTCNSSGPIMSFAAALGALFLWKWRHMTRTFRYIAVGMYLFLELAMSRPAYYVISKIDLTGSSTGYHRARLIESAIIHLHEWWLFGTDFTRHWMATGVTFSPNHADITNYYLAFGVNAGVPAIFLIIAVLWCAFKTVGRAMGAAVERESDDEFIYWCIGATIFAHAVTSISVAYFGQSMFFFWMPVALMSSIYQGEQYEVEEEVELVPQTG